MTPVTDQADLRSEGLRLECTSPLYTPLLQGFRGSMPYAGTPYFLQ